MSLNNINNNYKHSDIILDCLGDGIITTDKDGKIIYMNSAAENITGWTSEDAEEKLFPWYFL